MSGYRDLYWQASDGLRLHARDYPAASGPARLPILCLHGLTRNAKDFGALAPRLAELGHRVLALDVRGRGGSERGAPERYVLPAYAEDVERLAQAIGIGRAIFIGTSMGGLITMEVAARAAGLIHAAVVNDVGPKLSLHGLARIAGYAGAAQAFATWDDAAAQVRQLNEDALPHYTARDWREMAERMFRESDGVVIADYDPGIAVPFKSAPAGADPQQRWEALASDRPILVLRGARSDLLDQDAAEAMVAGKPNARLEMVRDVGHAPMLDEPDALAAIMRFLADIG
ncbi:alpha/beta fold hydrolase [Sphingomonas sp. NFR15]|uniref:alpha/beta fold hydrolase n=1 Tax=Sphingomonas sp. NFR15 TaxID=1566282 RepID=UPI0008843BA3|nr:alpha/beta hydrolase [Sphingomonas sp. NFR15]SDA11766.1 Pimeloyl-ACP methyl ester carboxylesterase [Sphingomonas sp. NFR15]